MLQLVALIVWVFGFSFWPKTGLSPVAGGGVLTAWLFVGGPLLSWFWLCMQAQRLRDAGASPMWAVFGFLPLAGLVGFYSVLFSSYQLLASNPGPDPSTVERAGVMLVSSLSVAALYSLMLMLVPGRHPYPSAAASQSAASLATSWESLNEPPAEPPAMSDITATSHVEAESAAGAEPELPLPQAPQPADRATARTVGGPSWSDQGQEEAVGDEAAPDARFRTAAFLAAAFAGAAIGAGIGRDAGGRIVGALVGLLVGYGIGYGVLWLNGQIGGPPRGPPLRMLASYGRRGLGALRRGIPIILLLAAFAAVGVAISVFTDPRTRNTVAPSARQASAPFLRPNALPTVADRAPVADEAKSKAQAAEHEAEATAKFRAGIAATLAAGMHPDRVARDLDLFPAARFVVPAPSRQRPSDPEPGPPRIVVLFGLLDPAADGASPCTLACYFDVDAYARKTVGGQSGKVADSSLELIGYEFGLGTFSQVGLTLRSPTWADPFDSTGATLFAP